MKLKYLGHSCFQLYVNGKYIVFDPFIRGNILAADAGINIDEVRADYILVTHGHDDHTGDLMYLAERTNATIVASWEIISWLTKQGYTNGHPMNVGGKWKFDFGTVKMTIAAHSSSLSDGTYAGVPAGFIIEAGGKVIYIAGDTALTLEMKLIAEEYKLDWAILPIGSNFTMDYKDACRAAEMVNCNHVIAMHYDTFGFIRVNHDEVKEYFNSNNKQIELMPIGSEKEL